MAWRRLIDLREEKDLKQKDVAEALYIAPRTYSSYETGFRSVPIEIFIKLADYYNTSIDYIVERSDVRFP